MILFILFSLLIAFIIERLYSIQYPKQHKQMSSFPGPPQYFLKGCNMPLNTRDRTVFMNESETKYGSPIVYKNFHKYWVNLHDPDHVEALLSSTIHLNKAQQYELMRPWLGNSLLIAERDDWRVQRKHLTSAFHYGILNDFCEIMHDHAQNMVDSLALTVHEHTINTKDTQAPILDICPYVTACTLDVISETSMGKCLSAQNTMKDNRNQKTQTENQKYAKSLDHLHELLIRRLGTPYLWNDHIYKLVESGKKSAEYIAYIHDFVTQVILERESNSVEEPLPHQSFSYNQRPALLDLLLQLKHQGLITDDNVREQVDTFMFAGHDTTGACVWWTLYILGHHPDIQAKVQTEVDQLFAITNRPTLTQLKSLKYLECCIKEGQRLYPPVPGSGRKLKEPLIIKGKSGEYELPPGIGVSVNYYLLHRNPEQFPDPEKYDPDRFLPENCVGRHPYAFCPFAAGPRNCIGYRFAMMELLIMVSHLLHHFTIRSIQPRKDMRFAFQFVLKACDGVLLEVNRRT